MAGQLRKLAKAVQSFFSASSSSADADAEPTLLHLPDELWIECILRNGKHGADGERLGASELIRLRRVSRSAWRIAREAKLEATVAREKERRARAQHDDRERRKRLNSLNPPIVRSALAGDTAAVISELDSGVAVDSCATWVESEAKMGGYDKEWTWSRDTALSMACSQVSALGWRAPPCGTTFLLACLLTYLLGLRATCPWRAFSWRGARRRRTACATSVTCGTLPPSSQDSTATTSSQSTSTQW